MTIQSKEHDPKPLEGYWRGAAGGERWGYMVIGAIVALCIRDGNTGPGGEPRRWIVNLTLDEAGAMAAIDAAIAAGPLLRVSAALNVLRERMSVVVKAAEESAPRRG